MLAGMAAYVSQNLLSLSLTGNIPQIIGQGGPTNDQFAALWASLASRYKSESKVIFGMCVNYTSFLVANHKHI